MPWATRWEVRAARGSKAQECPFSRALHSRGPPVGQWNRGAVGLECVVRGALFRDEPGGKGEQQDGGVHVWTLEAWRVVEDEEPKHQRSTENEFGKLTSEAAGRTTSSDGGRWGRTSIARM